MSSGAPGLDVLRETVARAVEARSLRSVAERIGLTHRGLGLFLAGGTPRAATLRRLREWYVREGAAGDAAELSADTARAALDVLVGYLPGEHRREVAAELIKVVRSHYAAWGRKPPKWLDELEADAGQ